MLNKLDVNLQNTSVEYSEAIVYHNGCYKFNNIEVVKYYPFINAVGVKGKTENIKKLSYLANVSYVCSVSKIYNLANFSIKNLSNNLEEIKFNNLSIKNNINNYTKIMYKSFLNNTKKNKFTACVLDTGVARHMDLTCIDNRLILQKDIENKQDIPYDDNGHGTFVAGIIGGNGFLSGKKIIGISPNTSIISVKIMNDRGESNVFNALDGMQWIADNYKKYNIKVVCMSFGAIPIDKDPLVAGVEALAKLGIIIVCASGNSGVDTFMSPAVSSSVISVGSVDNNYNISSFTSRGMYCNKVYPDVYAKGENLISLSNTGTYVSMSGTSVACPIICGYLCNIVDFYPHLTINEAKNIIKKSVIYKDNIPILDIY